MKQLRLAEAIVLLVLAGAATASQLRAQETGARAGGDTTRVQVLDTLTVTGRYDDLIGIAATASEGRVGAVDLRLRPITREGELLETVPGMIVTQHSGDGKANQYFIRGFNLDHGTDFNTRIEGMPLNMPSHAHGQGYTDLNFLVPELVDYVDYRLGVTTLSLETSGALAGLSSTLFGRSMVPLQLWVPVRTAWRASRRGARRRWEVAICSSAARPRPSTAPGTSRRTSGSSAAWLAIAGIAAHPSSRSLPWGTTTIGMPPTRSPVERWTVE